MGSPWCRARRDADRSRASPPPPVRALFLRGHATRGADGNTPVAFCARALLGDSSRRSRLKLRLRRRLLQRSRAPGQGNLTAGLDFVTHVLCLGDQGRVRGGRIDRNPGRGSVSGGAPSRCLGPAQQLRHAVAVVAHGVVRPRCSGLRLQPLRSGRPAMCSRLSLPLLSGELAICPGLLADGGVLPICLGRGCGRPGDKYISVLSFVGSSACSGARAQDARAGQARTAPVDVLKVLHPGPQLGLQRGCRHPKRRWGCPSSTFGGRTQGQATRRMNAYPRNPSTVW